MDEFVRRIRECKYYSLILSISIGIVIFVPMLRSMGQEIVVVDTDTIVRDGDTSSVSTLLGDKGEDGKISIVEALTAINNTGPGFTVNFNLPYGTVVPGGYSVKVPNTTIDGDVDGDEKPDIIILGSYDTAISLTILSSDNIIRNLVFEHMYLCCDADRNRIENSYIGTDITGMTRNDIWNHGVVIDTGAEHNILENNIISGNTLLGYNPSSIRAGILINNASFNEIRGNWIGLNAAGERLANDAAIYIEGDSEGNIIGGAKESEDCGGSCNVISGNKGSAIILSGPGVSKTLIQGNYFGLDPEGRVRVDNGWELKGGASVYLRCGANGNLIGGEREGVPCNGPCNKISGNFQDAVMLRDFGTTRNKIQGNYLEVSPDHIPPTLVMGFHGIHIENISSPPCADLINGVTTAGDGEEIGTFDSTNDRSTDVVNENEILPAETNDENQQGPENNFIGGERVGVACTGTCNMIGLYGHAIYLRGEGTSQNHVEGNYIGIHADGSRLLPNWFTAVVVGYGASENVIGGVDRETDCTGPCNVISGNLSSGVIIGPYGGEDNKVQGNFIGVSPDGTERMPNQNGIFVTSETRGTLIGGDREPGLCAGPCNLIAGNAEEGIQTSYYPATTGVTIRGNSIYENGRLGIDLGGDGVTYNNVETGEARPEEFMLFPMGVSAFYNETTDQTEITATLEVPDPDSATVDFYGNRELDPTGYGEGEWYYGEATHVGEGVFELVVPGKLEYPMLSSTATNAEGSTSEFGPRPPLILIPGISGSRLVALKDASELWPGIAANHNRLELYEDGDLEEQIVATDVIRTYFGQDYYGSLISSLTDEGQYKEYDVQDLVDRRTTEDCDITQRENNPNLFIFAYDWRLDNETSVTALSDYIGCIQRFFPGSEIDLLAHSMGGLVSRKYMLESPDNHVNKLVTVATPWLGTPKMIYVLATGDMRNTLMNVLIFPSTLRYVIGSFTGSHQLLPAGGYYTDFGGSPLIESGRDLNSNGFPFDFLEYGEYINVIDSEMGMAPFKPGTATDRFHAAPGQDDWRMDGDGSYYYSLIGIQDGSSNTIGRIAATFQTICTWTQGGELCDKKEAFEIKPYLTQGDGTVTRHSMERDGWVPENSHEVVFYGSQFGGDDAVEHSAVTSNPDIQASVLTILSQGWDLHSVAGGKLQINPGAVADQNQPVSRFLTISGASSLHLEDPNAFEIQITEGSIEGSAPGVDSYILGERIWMFLIPPHGDYDITIEVRDEPLLIEFTKGTPTTASSAQRYTDLNLPAGVHASLGLADSGVVDLRYDSDGDGTYETRIEPSVSLSGSEANDLEPPEIFVDTTEKESKVELTIEANDGASGVDRVLYSLDGAQFIPYVDPLILDPNEGTMITIIADDNAANRRTMVYDFSKPQFRVFLPVVTGGN